jgi:signal transduction histidine kinase/CheY-like chemotaxis protein
MCAFFILHLTKIHHETIPMTATQTQFRDTLQDLRREMFLRFTLVTMLFCALTGYLSLLEKPLPQGQLYLSLLVGLVAFLLRRAIHYNRNWPRYALIALLHVGLLLALVLIPVQWVMFLAIPVVFMSVFLVSNSVFYSPLLILLAVWGIGPGELLAFATILIPVTAVSQTAVSTFHTALTWYSSMHDRAEGLLSETRERRAELVAALRSLDIAYQNQQRLQGQLIDAQRRATEAQRLKEQFAANISHELRTPLNLILGFSEVMYRTPEVYGEGKFPPRLYRDMYQIYRSSRHLLAMIDDVLDLSHIEMSGFTIHFTPTDMNTFMEETAEMLGGLFRGGDVTFIADIAPDLPQLEIDATRLRQVFINLVTNAQRFTQAGSVTLRVMKGPHELVMSVADTGLGIPPEKLPHVFEEFYQVDYSLSRTNGGAGLGLSITRRFVEAHGGTIKVESEEGIGSTFTFTLPLRQQEPLSLREGTQMNVPDKDQCVLLLDADPALGAMVQRHLTAYRVVQVTNRDEIEDAVRRVHPQAVIHNRVNNDPPLNVGLPVPVIACSLPSTRWLVGALGVTDVLSKPVSTEQIQRVFDAVPAVNRVLIVDDDMGFVQLVQRAIETLGRRLTIYRAYDGVQALKTLREYPVDVVLLDIAMPEMDGFAVLEHMHDDPALCDLPVVLLTATRYLQDEVEQNGPLTIHQPDGLRPIEVVRVLRTLLEHIQPRPVNMTSS